MANPSSKKANVASSKVKRKTDINKDSKSSSSKTGVNEKSQADLLIPPSPTWHNHLPPLPQPATSLPAPSTTDIDFLSSKGASLLENDIKIFHLTSSASSEATFFTKVIHSGTLSDRLSALTLLVQSSPIHNTKALDTLKSMTNRTGGGRDESLKALRCIVDWWVGGGAPDRKLRYFRDQSLLHPQVTDKHIFLWYFEDWLKKYFFSVLQVLESLSLDPLPYVRIQAISLIFILLRDKPEQEQNLLRLLVNKLGDSTKSICSRASYHLLQLLQAHPSMKAIVVREIISLVLKPTSPSAYVLHSSVNKHTRFSSPEQTLQVRPQEKRPMNAHAQYYATITFNQIVLTPSDRGVAVQLIDIYFELFRHVLGADPEAAERNEQSEEVNEEEKDVKKDKKGRVLVKEKKDKGGSKVKTGAAGFVEVTDFNSKLISALLTGVNRALPFAKVELGDTKINAHLDTLFLITHKSTFNTSIQALVLIQQISLSLSEASSSAAKPIIDRYFRTLYESLHDSRLATSSKQAMYLNLLYKSIKADSEQTGERKKALVKRFVQILVSGASATEFVAGGLYLLGELFSTVHGLRSLIFDPEDPTVDKEPYDARKRDPLFAHAGNSSLWELTPLLHHYHPTISLLTHQLLTAQPLAVSADLSQNTLSHFLDRFVYKNPKKKATGLEGKGASAMQPAGSALEGIKLRKGEFPDRVQVNRPTFLKRKEQEVPVDQMFFYKYFKRKNEAEQRVMKRKGNENDQEEDDGEEDEVGEEEDEDEDENLDGIEEDEGINEADSDNGDKSEMEEDEIWRVMKATMPKDGDDQDLLEDDEEDDSLSDFDVALASDSDGEHGGDYDQEDGQDEYSSDDDFSLAEESDNEDLVSPGNDLPEGLIAYDGSDTFEGQDDEWAGVNHESERHSKGKRRRRNQESGRDRKKLRFLPTFASYEDYAKMIEEGPEEDI